MQPPQHLLIVDDNVEIRELLGSYLEQHGFQITLAKDGIEMRDRMRDGSFDLIVLDVMMPGEDGLSLCRFVQDIAGPPVIMLTAMSEDADCVVGLELGADDYVTKPFTPRVLLARIKAVLRRRAGLADQSSDQDNKKTVFGGWRLDENQRQLIADDGVITPLSNAEFKLLQVFLSRPKQVLSRDQLLVLTKGREAEPFDRSIDNQVSRLRRKLESDPQNPHYIKTVWGGGYMLAVAVNK